MECNKEEAIKAREMAEQKMQCNDFAGAQKVALRVQTIYPQLESITHLLAVCDVHCASEQKIVKDELDWYGILQIEQTVDDSLIKKQYRKLALLLHPDKNKYYGAEAAFKLVGEAQRVLSDPIKRQMHDAKRRTALGLKYVRNLQKKTRESSISKHQVSKSITRSPMMPRSTNTSSLQESQQSTHAKSLSKCPYCKITHQFSIPFMDKVMCCNSCKKSFVSRKTGRQTKIRGDQSADMQHSVPSKTTSASDKNPMKNAYGENLHPNLSYDANLVKKYARNSRKRGSNKGNDKRKRSEIDESCDSFLVGSREGKRSEIDESCESFLDGSGDCKRSEIDESCESFLDGSREDANENGPSNNNEVDCGRNIGGAIGNRSFEHDTGQSKYISLGKKVQDKCMNCPSIDDGPKKGSLYQPFDCQDTNYNDFDQIRDKKGFTAGQVWALYHPFDTMPRFYVLVKAVYRAKFKLRIVWLEPDPDDETGVEMGNCNFPRSCGRFIEGTSDMMDNLFTFSHQMMCEKGGSKNIYKIYPRKGETWAIFTSWNLSWDTESFRKAASKYQLVEVLSGFVEGVGVKVVYLRKVIGFASIFCQTVSDDGKTSLQIPPEEMSRFSHKIPSFQVLGAENKGPPKGSIELDPAAIPLELMS